MLSKKQSIKKVRGNSEEENNEFIPNEVDHLNNPNDIELPNYEKNTEMSNGNYSNLLLKCMKTDSYCFTLLDYFKKIIHISQIDFYSAYVQLLYCFKPKEL